MELYIVAGGVGKHVMFSALIEKLCEKHGSNISIMSAYPDVFKFHPKVDMSVDFNTPGFYDKYINKPETNIHHAEPYYSNYVKGESHLTNNWAEMFNIEIDSVEPDIYVDDFAYEEAKRFKKEHGKFIVVQFSGGQSPIGVDYNRPHITQGQVREYPRHLAQELVRQIKGKMPDVTILNYVLPNEQTASLDHTISIQAPFLFYVALCQMSCGHICIDSSLMHFSANKYNKRRGVSIWGSTGPKNLGYKKNFNLTNSEVGHSIRPLTNTLGDVFKEDGSPWTEDKTMTHVPVEKILNNTLDVILWNEDLEDEMNNVVEDLERKTKQVDLDQTTAQLLIGLRAQYDGLYSHINRIVDDYTKKNGLDGQYNLSNDGTKLIKQ